MTTGRQVPSTDRVLGDGSDPLVVGPPPAFVRQLVARVRTDRTVPSDPLRLLCTPEAAATAFEEFLVAADAADAVREGRLAVRTDPTLDASLLFVDGRASALVSLDGTVTAVGRAAPDDSGEPSAALSAVYEERWSDAEPFDFDRPGREELLASMRGRWPEAADTLAELLAAVEETGFGDGVDPVAACTLVAARHRLLTMELGEWVGEVGVSSRTEVSRAKSRLVEAGLVDTERELAGVGRPRQRLTLADESLADADGEELLAAARAALEE